MKKSILPTYKTHQTDKKTDAVTPKKYDKRRIASRAAKAAVLGAVVFGAGQVGKAGIKALSNNRRHSKEPPHYNHCIIYPDYTLAISDPESEETKWTKKFIKTKNIKPKEQCKHVVKKNHPAFPTIDKEEHHRLENGNKLKDHKEKHSRLRGGNNRQGMAHGKS